MVRGSAVNKTATLETKTLAPKTKTKTETPTHKTKTKSPAPKTKTETPTHMTTVSRLNITGEGCPVASRGIWESVTRYSSEIQSRAPAENAF